MKKKIIVGVIITVIIILLSSIVLFSINKTDNDFSKKAYKLFGDDYCQNTFNNIDDEHTEIAGMAFTSYNCEICNQKYEHPNTATPKICYTCANATNRCEYCGKLKNED